MSAPAAPARTGFARGTWVVAQRELSAALDSSVAWVFVIGAVLLANSLFMNEFFLTGLVDMSPFFERLPLLLLLLLPAISMRLWAEDRRQRTYELWMTLPLRPGQVVLGKFVSALVLYALFLAGSLPIVVMLIALGRPDLGAIGTSYAGALLLGGFFLALGSWLSILSRDQVTAFLASALAAGTFVATGDERVVAVLDGLAPARAPGTWLAEHVSVLPAYAEWTTGWISAGSALRLLLGAALFLWLTAVTARSVRD